MSQSRLSRSVATVIVLAVVAAACSSKPEAPPAPVVVDGSSTVYPISAAAAAEFLKKRPQQMVRVNSSSTGVGLERFCAGQVDVADASRHITQAEAAACASAGVEFIEVPIAYDAISVVVHRANTWATSMTVAELTTLWQSGAQGKVTKWSQVRKGWPDREVHLVGPDDRSGTFDYFNEVITGAAKDSRKDYKPFDDDERLVAAVQADELALGYVGFTYYERQEETLQAVAVDDLDEQIGPGPIEPTVPNVRRGVYRPLSRPLFIYIKVAALARPEVQQFVDFYARFAPEMVERAGGVRLNTGRCQGRCSSTSRSPRWRGPRCSSSSTSTRASRRRWSSAPAASASISANRNCHWNG